MISRVPFPNCRGGVIGPAIASNPENGNPENDRHLPPWQEAVGHEIVPDTHENGCTNGATTGLTPERSVMLFQDFVFGCIRRESAGTAAIGKPVRNRNERSGRPSIAARLLYART
jgi:hypothetical protein